MTAPAMPIQRLNNLLSGLLDKGYTRAVGPVLRALSSDPRVTAATAAFEREATRLEAAGETFTPDNPALMNLRTTLETVMKEQSARIDTAGQALQQDAIAQAQNAARQLALPGISDAQLRAIGVQWNQPNPDAIMRVINYTQSGAWADTLDKFGAGVAEQVGRLALAGIIDGQNPRTIARSVATGVSTIPRYRAEAILRTLQLNAYRGATAENFAANADVLEPEGIRIAALDGRTCPPCVALHGTRVPIDEPIQSHYHCRCIVVPIVRGFVRNIVGGADWFDGQSEAVQRSILGDAAFNAWSDGEVSLDDFIGHENDELFGPMITTNSLKAVLGPQTAQKYYQRNYKGSKQ